MTPSKKNWALVFVMLATAGLASGTVVVVGISGDKVIVSLPLVSFLGSSSVQLGKQTGSTPAKGRSDEAITLETLPAVGVCAGAA